MATGRRGDRGHAWPPKAVRMAPDGERAVAKFARPPRRLFCERLAAGEPDGKKPEGEKDLQLPEQFMIVVRCPDGQHQVELLERFEAEGLECKALVGGAWQCRQLTTTARAVTKIKNFRVLSIRMLRLHGHRAGNLVDIVLWQG